MSDPSSAAYRFGDLLAFVHEQWVRQMARQLAAVGHQDYRRSDAMTMRPLLHGPRAISELGTALGISRQAARKLVTGLERRGYATTARDEHDARQLNVSLTASGEAFACAITDTIDALNRRLGDLVAPAQLLAADTVLRATLPSQHARDQAAVLIPVPPPRSPCPRRRGERGDDE